MKTIQVKNTAPVLLITLFLLMGCGKVFAQSNRSIALNLLADSRTGGADQQQWLAAMSEVGADRVKVQTVARPRPSIEEDEVGGLTLITVKGVISNDRIKFPGKSFKRSDAAGIRDFIDQLRSDGMKTTLAQKKGFGLTSEQLAAVYELLNAPVNRATENVPFQEMVEALLDATPLPYDLTAEAKEKLTSDPISVKLKGLSSGTALAILLRQQDLAFYLQPERGRGVKLKITLAADAKESWQPGWPVEEAPVNAFPKMFQRIPLQVNQTPLASVLAAIQRRLAIPFVIDPAAVKDKAGNPVDLSKVLVTYNKKKTSYALALSKLLLQAKPRLRHEIREDEAGTRFLWITKQ